MRLATTFLLTHCLALAACEIPFSASRACRDDSECAPRTHCETGFCVPDVAPSSLGAPLLSGERADGAVLTTTEGTWAGTPPFRFAYRWERCDASGRECVAIPGATSQSYRLQSADLGRRTRSVVTAENEVGRAESASATSEPIHAGPPASLAPPTIAGDARSGATMVASVGEWGGTGPLSFEFRWLRCDGAGATCTDYGASSGSLVPTDGDIGATVRVEVSARNAQGEATATSAAAGPIRPQPPTAVAQPTVSGTAQVGQSLVADEGSWLGSPPLTFSLQWQACAAGGCMDLDGETGSTHLVGPLEVDLRLRVAVRASNAVASVVATSEMTAPVLPLSPANLGPPTVAGAAIDGQTLTASPGAWSGGPSFAYQWQRCDAAGTTCSDVPAASTTYAIAAEDVGSTLRVEVTGSNAGGTSPPAYSSVTAVILPRAPLNVSPPALGGVSLAGETLTSTLGTWEGTPPLNYARQWLRCDAAGAGCSDIAGATSATYTLAVADYEATIRVVVTATNAGGSAPATSAQTALVPRPPTNSVLPAISGTVLQGQTLTATSGTWTGTPTIVYAYQWRRCDAAGASCSDIAGATGSSYTLAAADYEATLRVVVTATNAGGSAPATSARTALVPRPPANTVLPAISGTALQGQTLTATTGTWTGTPTITYVHQWRRCDAAGAGCSDIAGATGATYVLAVADYEATLRVVVTATNAGGSAPATSAQTALVPRPPANTVLPAISGTVLQGQTLTATTGTWTGTPTITYAHQWRRCDAAGSGCSDIAGATGATYVVAVADYEATIRVVVTATNAGGSAPATSAQTALVPRPPANTVLPVVSGTTTDGEVLSTSDGTWTGTPAPTFSYQWQRCDAAGANCAAIAGATSWLHTLTSADVGQTLRATVTATNLAGTAPATSSESAVVAALLPANQVPPAISGVAADGETLSATAGTWTGTPTISYAYQWQRCDSAGANCSAVGGAAASTYVLGPGDVGTRIRVAVTASNAAGPATATSDATAAVISLAPTILGAPVLSGTLVDGQSLSASTGSWDGTMPFTYGYQWERCNAAGASCASIAGATASSYDLQSADVDGTVRVQVTATNGSGSATASSAASALIAGLLPSNGASPTISGPPQVGATLTAGAGSWDGTTPLSYFWQWQHSVDGSSWSDIAGATGAAYVVDPGLLGELVRVRVTASNACTSGCGSAAPVFSVATDTIIDAGGAPGLLTPPVLAGTTMVGAAMTTSAGTWSNSPTSFEYQWQSCLSADPISCADLPGETASSLTLDASFDGLRLRARVTAVNGFGNSPIASSSLSTPILAAGSAPVTAAPLSMRDMPYPDNTVDSLAQVGSTIFFSGSFNLVGYPSGGGALLSAATGGYDREYARIADTWMDDVYAVAADGAGGWYLGGYFTQVDGVARNNVLHLLQDGTVDPAWDPNVDGMVRAIAVSGNTVYLGGEFATVNGATPRLNAAAVDAVTGAVRPFAPDPEGAVRAVAVLGGKVFLGGDFATVRGSSYSYLVSVDASSGVNSGWNPGPNGSVYALAVLGDRIYVGGAFTSFFGGGLSRNNAASFESVGTQTSFNPNVSGAVHAIATAGNDVYLGGLFTTVNGSVPRKSAASFDATTGTVRPWNPKLGASSWVNALAIEGATVYLGGTFSTLDAAARRNLAAVDAVSGTATSWAPEVEQGVDALAVANGEVYAGGGTFRMVNARPLKYLAAVDLTTRTILDWNPAPDAVVKRLAASDTTLYVAGNFRNIASTARDYMAAFDGANRALLPWNPAPNSFLSSVFYGGGKVYASGNFTSIGGQSRTCLAALDPVSAIASAWNPSTAACGFARMDLAGANVIGVGSFTTFNGMNFKGAVALDAASGAIAPWDPNSNASRIEALDVADGEVYLGGNFTTLNGGLVARNRAGSVAAVGPVASEFDPNANNDVQAIAVDGPIAYLGGRFTTINGGPARPGIAAVDASSGVTTSWSPTLNLGTLGVKDLLVDREKALWAGGDFQRVGGKVGGMFLTRFAPQPAILALPVITGTATEGLSLAVSSGAWEGASGGLTYQWRRCDAIGQDCADIAGATAASYLLGAADVGRRLRAVVTATNSYGSTWQYSRRSDLVSSLAAPSCLTSPSVAGNAQSAGTLFATAGEWAGGPKTFTYQWQQCDAGGAACADIAGATAPAFSPRPADVGLTLRVGVVTTNASGTSAPAWSTAVLVNGNAPQNLSAPTISPTNPRVGVGVSVTSGTWADGGTLSFQWRLCDGYGNSCADLAGETGQSRTALAGEKGKTFRVQVTNTNAYGSATVETEASSLVVNAVPSYAGPGGSGSGTGGQAVISLTSPVSAGDAIVVAWSAAGTAGPTGITIAGYGSCTASTYSTVHSAANLISGIGWCSPLKQNLTAGTSITVAFPAGSSVVASAIIAPGVTGRDFASGTFSNNSNPTTYNATPSAAGNELLVAVVGSDSNRAVTAAGDSFTISQSGSAGPYRHTSLYRQVSTTGVYQASATLSNAADYSIVIVGFR